ncbi:amino acid ABC transporter permease [Demequina aurantiaca]|uniref:amino acid ABC transporter permease n=1 Tax=Demequina aurantiaca TaxID=676200 RepID=UPI000A0202D1|nr:amino acid ABC transporter permease [Demequina aurantiaca]
MSNETSVLYEAPGPRAKARDRIFTVVFTLIFVGLLVWAGYTAYSNGIFDDRWAVLWDPPRGQSVSDVWITSILMSGIWGTLKPVLIAIPIALALALALTILRQSPYWIARVPARVVTEVFRGIPVLLIMYFGVIGLNIDPLWAVVLGLVVYNMAVVAEILRAGIAALPSGQKEAGLSIGLSPLQTLLRIQLPQAVRIMLPALISQIVVLLKDSSLGFIIGYSELLKSAKDNYNFFGESTKVVFIFVVAVLYILINMSVSRLATYIEGRMRTKSKTVGGLHVEGKADGPPGGVTATGIGANTRTGDSAL